MDSAREPATLTSVVKLHNDKFQAEPTIVPQSSLNDDAATTIHCAKFNDQVVLRVGKYQQ